MNTPVTRDLDERLLNFSFIVIRASKTIGPDVNRDMIRQLIRAATSIGANYAEAQNAISRADFRNKIYIAKKEAAETNYWLKLVYKLSSNNELEVLIQESQEILLILQAIITKLRTKSIPTP